MNMVFNESCRRRAELSKNKYLTVWLSRALRLKAGLLTASEAPALIPRNVRDRSPILPS